MLHVQLNYATTNVSQLSIFKSPSVVHQGLFVKAPNSMVFTMWAVQNDTVVNSGHDLGLGWHSVFLAANDMHDIFVFSVFFFLWWRYLVSSKRGKRHDEVFHERATMFYTVLHTVVCAIWNKQGSKKSCCCTLETSRQHRAESTKPSPAPLPATSFPAFTIARISALPHAAPTRRAFVTGPSTMIPAVFGIARPAGFQY